MGPETSTAATKLLGRLSRVKGKAGGWRWLPVLPALLLIAACTGPTLRPQTPTGTGAIVQEMPSLRVSVEAEAWHGRPRSLADHVLPFLIVLKNTGMARLTITWADFLLLDDANRQYFSLASSEVVTLLEGRTSGVGVSPAVGVSGSTAGGTSVGLGLGILLGGSGTDTRDVIPQALPEGPLLPDAEVKGFVYFPRPLPGYKSLRLVVAPQGLPDHPRLDFEFRRAGS
ncbi:MAG: hypothetical protein ACHQ7N_01135 [Candidatus Methylomirabilales bacterium]